MAPQHARIRLKRSGGFAGIATEAVIDTAQIDPHEAQAILAGLDAADLDALAHRLPARPGPPDTFCYALEVDRGSETHHIALTEADVPPALEPVITALAGRAHPVRKH
jgi:hypothetical protein